MCPVNMKVPNLDLSWVDIGLPLNGGVLESTVDSVKIFLRKQFQVCSRIRANQQVRFQSSTLQSMALKILAWKIFKAELPIEKFQKSICEISEFEKFLVSFLGKITCEMFPILMKVIDMLFRVVRYKPIKP